MIGTSRPIEVDHRVLSALFMRRIANDQNALAGPTSVIRMTGIIEIGIILPAIQIARVVNTWGLAHLRKTI